MKTAAHLIALYLEQKGVGTLGGTGSWGIYVGVEPAKPDACITLYDTGGLPPWEFGCDTAKRTTRPAFQIRIRGSNYPAMADKLQEIRELLHPLQDWASGTQIVHGAWMASGPISLGLDDNDRQRLTDNWEAEIQFSGNP